jgi:hypothetical protein
MPSTSGASPAIIGTVMVGCEPNLSMTCVTGMSGVSIPCIRCVDEGAKASVVDVRKSVTVSEFYRIGWTEPCDAA